MSQIRGIHVAAMFCTGFAIIIAVNLALAFSAVRTFPGLEVANSYVASQSFERRRAAQEALGWTVAAAYSEGRLRVAIRDAEGRPAPVRDLSLHLGRPTEARDDRTLDLGPDGAVALTLAPGPWRLDLTALAPDGTAFQKAVAIEVAG